MRRVLTAVALTGALVGGGAAIANAASSTSTTTATSTAKTPAPARAPSNRPPRSGAHHCPGMGGSRSSSSAPSY
jgi:hypothetical protein